MMMSCFRRGLVVASAGLAAVVAVAGDIRLPDISKGEINGKVAMLAWPISGVEIDKGGAGARATKLLSPEGCSTYLVSTQDLEHEVVYPCGKWFQPAEGRYRVWLEGPDLSTADYGVVEYEAE